MMYEALPFYLDIYKYKNNKIDFHYMIIKIYCLIIILLDKEWFLIGENQIRQFTTFGQPKQLFSSYEFNFFLCFGNILHFLASQWLYSKFLFNICRMAYCDLFSSRAIFRPMRRAFRSSRFFTLKPFLLM